MHPYIKSVKWTPATAISPVEQIPGKVGTSAYELQGRRAREADHPIEACPYYATSTAANAWLKGFRS